MSEHSTALPEVKLNRRGLRLAGLVVLIVFLAVAAIGVGARLSSAKSLRSWTDEQAIPTVAVAKSETAVGQIPLELPAQMDAYINAPIYARTSGYLKAWYKDIGAQVKAGELLGEIDTPDLDQQILQAQAALNSARANAALAKITANRWQQLQKTDPDSVSTQSVDQNNATYAAQLAQVNAAQADLDRLKALKSYARLVAPFDGRVTARNTDVGALVNEGGTPGQVAPLFQVSDTRKLRVYVRVPQVYAPGIHRGDEATLSVPEYPGQTFKAKVEADARAISPTSGTTLVQLQVDNKDGRLLPSSYASVRFQVPGGALGVRVPAEALVFDDHGLRVAVLGADDRVHFKDVTIRRDYGKSVEVGSGLDANDRVIVNPPDGLAEGDRVHVADNEQPAAEHHEKA